MQITYVIDTEPAQAERSARHAQHALAFLRAAGHRLQLLRWRRSGERARHDASLWRVAPATWPALPAIVGAAAPLWRPARALDHAFRHGATGPGQVSGHTPGQPPDHVHGVGTGPLVTLALRAARRAGLGTSLECIGGDVAQPWSASWSAPLSAAWQSLQQRAALGQADIAFAPSMELAQALRQQGAGRVVAVGRGVDSQLFTPALRDPLQRHAWRAATHNPVLLYVGRLDADGNAALALQVFERLRRAHCGLRMVVAGDGPTRQLLLRSAHPRARFVGAQGGIALARLYASADVLLLPQRSDPVGDTLLEGLASGLAVASFDTVAAQAYLGGGRWGSVAGLHNLDDPLAAFEAAARDALGCWAPDSLLRCEARAAALRLGWRPTLAAMERHVAERALRSPSRSLQLPAA